MERSVAIYPSLSSHMHTPLFYGKISHYTNIPFIFINSLYNLKQLNIIPLINNFIPRGHKGIPTLSEGVSDVKGLFDYHLLVHCPFLVFEVANLLFINSFCIRLCISDFKFDILRYMYFCYWIHWNMEKGEQNSLCI